MSDVVEIKRLRAENERLRDENKRLRLLLWDAWECGINDYVSDDFYARTSAAVHKESTVP